MKGSIKKSCLKRTLAFISALSVIGSFSSTIGATKMISDNIISAAATDDTTSQDSTEITGKYSRIDIEISNKFDFVNEVNCTVSVIKVNSDNSETIILSDKPLTVGNEMNSTASIRTDFIENGTYIVEVHAPGFETFKQEISDFDNMICVVKVTLGFDNRYTYIDKYELDKNGEAIYLDDTPVIEKPESDHPGAMKVGDVNGDGKITKRDETLLLEAIDSSIMNNGNIEVNLEREETLCSDLNYDGVTNLADLTFFTKGYIDTKGWNTKASLIKDVSEEYKIASLSKVETIGNTESNGVKLSDLLKSSSNNDNDDNKSDESARKLELTATEKVPVMNEDGTQKVDEDGKPVYEEKEVEISEEHPVGVSMDLDGVQVKEMTFGTNADAGSVDVQLEDGTWVSVPFKTNSQPITEEKLESVGEGETSTTDTQPVTEAEFEAADEDETSIETPNSVIAESNVSVKIDENGNISLNLENQIAVKKITLKITKVKNAKLAEIGTVEFLNGMEERISEPQIDFPTNVEVVQNCGVADKYATIIANWDKPVNGGSKFEYEVSTSSATRADGSFSSTIPGVQNTVVESPTFTLASEHGNFKLIKINTTYYVHVRCIDEDYKSKWSDYAKVTTVSNSIPAKPDYVSAKGNFRSLKVSWGSDNTNSTTGYKLYYRDITNNLDENGRPTGTYDVVDVGKTTSHILNGLEDKTEYEVYVVGYNPKGESPESVHAMGKTISAQPVEMRKYNAINCDDDGNTGNAHIVSVVRGGGNMINSLKDTAETEKIEKKYNEIINDENATQAEKNAATKNKNAELAKITKTAWGVVDGNQESYYSYGSWNDGGITYEFDNEYELSTIALSVPYNGPNFFQTWITAWDENGNAVSYSGWKGMSRTKDKNGKEYFFINFPKVKAKKIKLSFGNYAGEYREIAYSEIIFYHYDSIMEEIMALYVDDLHTVLRDDVTQETIDALRDRIVLPDKRNGEYHPNKANLENELNTAEKLLNAENISKPILIHNSITTYDPTGGKSRKYSGLNAWQPLGVSAGANTEITVYVGSPSKKTGDSTELKLIATQYNSESNGVILKTQALQIGANTITIPSGGIAGAEAGGALYIQHHGGDQSKVYYSVRVEGGTEVPILDLYQITDSDERFNRAADYIEALEAHVANMENEHNRIHKGSKYMGERNSKLDYDYDKKLCIAGATDILCDTMMYSLPAHQILAGLGDGSVEDRAEKLIRSMESMEEMMKLFYQHKGMSPDAVNVVDRIPNQHLNIRYQRMFQGAAMYAAGNHIGIQWGTASSMVNSKGVKADENGRYVSGSYFGWGIAHEIGHNINDSSYVLAEITNNYFALLAQSQDTNKNSRLNYNNIFKKVTSNTKGNADQGTQLGMYWQLHLAYDKDFNFKTYDTNDEILENLFYARMDTYSRNPARAPQPYGTALTLSGNTDQNLMRLACAAAEKNVLEFFERWGKTPDATTRAYASQFPKETRAIMYANDDSRVYAMTDESWLVNDDGSAASMIDDVKVSVGTGTRANKVTLSIDVSDMMYKDDILGYEIVRCVTTYGDVKETPIAFTSNPYYTDTVTSFNNRTVSYKVTLIDHYLNRSEVFTTDTVKIQHDGSLDKSNWTISTETGSRYFTAPMITHEASEDELPCEHTVINPAIAAIDDDLETVYEAKVTRDPSIYINFNQPLVVCGLKYTSGTTSNDSIGYFIYVKNEAGGWQHVATGNFNGSGIAYFANADKKYISTYETTEIRLQLTNQNGKTISIAELDVLGVTGDNVDFRRDGEKAEAAFGILSGDYKYGTREQDFIPEGSLVFTGSYKGNPTYNAVILYDENGNIVGGTGVDDEGEASQIILADVPDGSIITDVSNGTWVYWINPEDIDNMVWPEKVRVELYRVNNAITNEGQRIVSDSLFEKVPDKDKMSPITIGGNRKYNTEVTTEGGDKE